MGLFEKVAVTDLKVRLSIAAGVAPFVASVFVGAAVIEEEWAFWVSLAVGAAFWLLISTGIYRWLSK